MSVPPCLSFSVTNSYIGPAHISLTPSVTNSLSFVPNGLLPVQGASPAFSLNFLIDLNALDIRLNQLHLIEDILNLRLHGVT